MARWDNATVGMSDITVDKLYLLKVIRDNRTKHAAAYKEAVVAYRLAALKRLTELASDVQADPPRQVSWNLPLPEQYLGDYDKAIRMMELDSGDDVRLSEDAYDRLIEDHWDWQQRFTASTLGYTSAGRQHS
jgi:hypothetical protein